MVEAFDFYQCLIKAKVASPDPAKHGTILSKMLETDIEVCQATA